MSDYYIGLSGLAAAQRAFDVIGNNIANAATEGYHRQKLDLSPAFSQHPGTNTFIGGVNIEGVSRVMDSLLELEILRQKSTLSTVSQQADTLSTIEAAFGEFATEQSGLNAAIDNFFNALQDLSAHPAESIWQNQAVSQAQTLSGQFRYLGQFIVDLKTQIKLKAENITDTINTLVGQIGELNSQIEKITMVGGDANSISDQRDQYISELSELINFQAVIRGNGTVDLNTNDIPLVTGSAVNRIEADFTADGKLGLSIAGASNYTTNIQGGAIGAVLILHNETISGISEDLDRLADAIIQEVNHHHVMGIGSAGSFEDLTGNALPSGNLSEIGNIVDGTLYIRVTHTSTGEITRHAVPLDADTDTLADVATSISAITGLTASLNSSNQLSISGDPGYLFDFMPAVLPQPTLTDFDDASPPQVTLTGTYTGSENDTFEFTVKGDGSVGNGNLELEVRDQNGSGELLTVLNIGSGYAAGDFLEIGSGLKIAFSSGNLAESDGDTFSVDIFADSDTAGFLSAVGLNTFFSGGSAVDMAVSQRISEEPQKVATSIGPEGADNNNITLMAAIKDKNITGLGNMNCGEFYRKLSTDIGQELSVKEMQKENIEAILLNLSNRQSEISGVDINEEAAQLLVFEQLFQAMGKYMNTIHDSVNSLMEIL